MRKYCAVAACAALLLCAYPAYNVLKSQNPPKLHSYITVEAGDIGAIKAYRQESSDVGGGEGPGEGPNLGVIDDPVGDAAVQLGAEAYQLLMDHFGDSRPDWYGGAYLDDSGALMVLLVEDRNPGDKSLELEVMKAVGDLPVCFASAKYSRNELERIPVCFLPLASMMTRTASFWMCPSLYLRSCWPPSARSTRRMTPSSFGWWRGWP